MDQKEDLEEIVGDLRMMSDMSSKQKRYNMYRDWIDWKSGYLGKGERKQVHKCVRELIILKFPPVEGDTLAGFKEA